MIKRFLQLLLLAILLITISYAGEIFGTFREDGKTVKKGIKVEIISPKKTYSTETDNYGSYRLFVVEKGKCLFKTFYNDKIPTFEVYSYDKSTRYDFIIEKKDTTYTLKRK
jgi:hypothetical protein